MKQQWILGIGTEEPIHASSAHDEFLRLRRTHANKKIQLIMAPRVIDTKNQYEEKRTKFDQMRPIIASALAPSCTSHYTMESTTQNSSTLRPSEMSNIATHLSSKKSPSPSTLIDPAGSIVPSISVLVHSSSQPDITTNINDCFAYTNPLKSFWIQTIYEQYDKNASYRVFTKPIPKQHISSDTLILKSVLAPTVKATDITSLWKLNVRHCVNGKPMKGLASYGATRASTVSPETV